VSNACFSWNESGKPQQLASLPVLALALLAGVCLLQIQPIIQIATQPSWLLDRPFYPIYRQGPIWTHSEILMLLPVSLWAFYKLPQLRMMLALLMGYLWALLFAQVILQQQLPDAFIGQNIVLEGVIEGLPEIKNKSVRFDFKVLRYLSVGKNADSISQSLASTLPTHIRLSWYYYKGRVRTGEHWRLNVRIKSPHGMQNKGGFDYEKWLYQQGIRATGYVRKSKDNKALGVIDNGIDRLREHVLSVLSKLPNDTYSGLLQALTIGHKSSISQQQWLVLRDTGTSHLMAISGLHIGLVAGLVFLLTQRLVPARICHWFSATQIAALVSLLIAGFYSFMAGFGIPTQRAFIMLFVVVLAVLSKRPGFSLENLSLALIAVLLMNPNAVLSLGFWLSFSAVIMISLITSARINCPQSTFMAWLQGVKIQWLIALGMMPLSMVLFQQSSIISPVANMLVIPMIGFIIVPLLLLASIISFVSIEASVWVFTQVSELMSWLWVLLTWLAKFPFASWQHVSAPMLQSGLAILGVIVLLLPRGFPMRYSGLIFCLPLLLYQTPKPKPGEFWVDVIDVGQGLSVLVRTTDKSLLYDTGAKFSERFDIGRRVVVPYLKTMGLQQLNQLIISHGDNDHAGGANSILEMIAVQNLLVEPQMVGRKKRFNGLAKACKKGLKWQWNGVYFSIIHPGKAYKKSNNRSCVIKVWNKGYSLLLSGDIEARAENQLLQYNAHTLQSDILLVPHHGSNTSSSRAWLKKVAPQLAIVSAGYKNRFKHPTKKVLARYKGLGIQVLNTANHGMIQLKIPASLNNGPIEFDLQRKVSLHYWNHRLDNVLYK